MEEEKQEPQPAGDSTEPEIVESPPDAEEEKSEAPENVEMEVKIDISTGEDRTLLNTKIKEYSGANPFLLKPLSCYDKFKIVFFLVSGIALIKILLILLLLIFAAIIIGFCKCFKCCKPLGRLIIFLTLRALLFIFGFYWICSDGSMNKSDGNTPGIVVANHHTAFDGFLLLWKVWGTVAAKKEVRALPVAGIGGDLLKVIWVDRNSKDGRRKAIDQIKTYATDAKYPTLVIFPQGICSHLDTITTFKAGAFLTGAPVQPVCLDYSSNTHSDMSFIGQSMIWEIFFHGLCQFINYSNIIFLDPYVPSADEIADPGLFGESVRIAISDRLGVATTAHGFEDFLLFKKANQANTGFNTRNMIMEDVLKTTKIRIRAISHLAEVFMKWDSNNDGYIDIDEFSAAFARDKSQKNMKNLFRLFSQNSIAADTSSNQLIQSDKIGFEAFVTGVSVCYIDAYFSDALMIFFDAVCFTDEKVTMKQYILNVTQRAREAADLVATEMSIKGETPNFPKLEWQLLDAITDELFESDTEKLNFQQFSERVGTTPIKGYIQLFLQFMLALRLGVKLESNDFTDPSEVFTGYVSLTRNNSIAFE